MEEEKGKIWGSLAPGAAGEAGEMSQVGLGWGALGASKEIICQPGHAWVVGHWLLAGSAQLSPHLPGSSSALWERCIWRQSSEEPCLSLPQCCHVSWSSRQGPRKEESPEARSCLLWL